MHRRAAQPADPSKAIPIIVFVILAPIMALVGLVVGGLIVGGPSTTSERIDAACRSTYHLDSDVTACQYRQTLRVLSTRADNQERAVNRAVGD